ncbi:hypothetical protein FQA39_LY09294 [Lamprigera yunnana]|nr:hypothetical protein FQA39_LY09294 [Lamprigera yunnana]
MKTSGNYTKTNLSQQEMNEEIENIEEAIRKAAEEALVSKSLKVKQMGTKSTEQQQNLELDYAGKEELEIDNNDLVRMEESEVPPEPIDLNGEKNLTETEKYNYKKGIGSQQSTTNSGIQRDLSAAPKTKGDYEDACSIKLKKAL